MSSSSSDPLLYPDTISGPVIGFQVSTDVLRTDQLHRHKKAQLLYTMSGHVEVDCAGGHLLVPPSSAAWIPSGMAHRVRVGANARFGCVYLNPDLVSTLPTRMEHFRINPLVRELLLRFSNGLLYNDDDECRQTRMASVLVDELGSRCGITNTAISSRDPRLQRLITAMLAEPGRRLTIEHWGKLVGASHRTLTRLFQNEVGKSFSAWRQELHVELAIRELEAGTPVASIAIHLGYDSPSAFIAMFKKNTGYTPGSYAEARIAAARPS